ncbi:MAG: O-antigen ligase family protein [Terracidiphilus sp.]
MDKESYLPLRSEQMSPGSRSVVAKRRKACWSLFYWLNILPPAVAIVLTIVPFARQNINIWFTVLALGIWALTAVILRPQWPLRLSRCFYFVPLWLAYASCEAIRVGTDLRFIGGYILFLFPALIYNYYRRDRRALSILSTAGILGFIVGAVMSIKVLWINPLAARLVSTNLTILTEYWRLGHSGVGDFRFVYGVALLLPLLVAIGAGTGRILFLRPPIWACVCVFAYFLYLATFAMSIYIMIVGSLVAVFLHIRRIKLKFAASLLLVAAGVLFLVFGADLMMIVSKNVKSDVLSIKARALASVLPGGPAGGSIASDRSSLYGISVRTFLENPVTGAGAYYSVTGFDIGLEHGIAGHSEVFDTLARYGLVGAGIFLSILFPLAFRAVSEWKGTAYGKSALVMWMLFLLMCFSNPVSGQTEIGVTVFLLWPALPKVFAAKKLPDCVFRAAHCARW